MLSLVEIRYALCMRVRARRDVCASCVQARRDPVYVQARSTRSCAYERMCTFSSRFMRNTAVRARRNLECLVENTIPRRDLVDSLVMTDGSRRDCSRNHLELYSRDHTNRKNRRT